VTLEAFDPFSKQPDFKKCAVRVSKVPAEAEAAGDAAAAPARVKRS